jgi:hypothetical protein
MAPLASTASYRLGSTSLLPPWPHHILTVVPLIGYQRYYGEDMVWSAGGAGAGPEEQAARGSALGEPGWTWRAQQTAGDRPQPKGGGAHTGNARGQPTSAEGPGPASIPSKTAKNLNMAMATAFRTNDNRGCAVPSNHDGQQFRGCSVAKMFMACRLGLLGCRLPRGTVQNRISRGAIW